MARVFVVLALVAFAGFSKAATTPLLDVNAVVGANVFPDSVSHVGSGQDLLSALTNPDTLSIIFQNFLNNVGSAKGAITDDLAERQQNFKNKLFTIFKNNFNPLNTFTMALNKFADMSDAEFKATHTNAVPETSGNGSSTEEAQVGSSLRRKRQATGCPASKDWNAEGMVTPVRDQGQCGSCYAFGSTATLEAMYAIKCGVKNIDLSEQNLMDCSVPQGNKGGCEGGNAKFSLTYFQSAAGLAMESEYPYKTATGTSCQAASTKAGKVNAFNRVSPLNDEKALACALAQTGPVAVMVNADGWSQYKGGVFGAAPVVATPTTAPKAKRFISFFSSVAKAAASAAQAAVTTATKIATLPLEVAKTFTGAFNSTSTASLCSSDAGKADHLVLLTGYGTDENGQDYWTIKNSWGAKWGENGYIRIKRGQNACGVANNPYQITDVQC